MTSVCEDKQKHPLLVGGISISPQRALGWVGTLGFFATVNGTEGPKNIALVTNNHVLEKNGGQVGDIVYQPDLTVSSSTNNNPIATILAIPDKGDRPFAYPNEGSQQYYVDAASALLSIKVSSWCNTNCGVSFANRLSDTAGGSSAIADIGRAQVGDIVVKVGRETRLTKGRVKKVDFSLSAGGLSLTNAIEIEPLGPDCNGITRFTAEGDSGAALVTLPGRKLVGLVFSAGVVQTNGLACHIHPVLAALGVTAITEANPVHGNPAAVGMSADEPVVLDGSRNETLQLRERLLASPEGRRLFGIAQEWSGEVVGLVNHNRRVMIAWHRNKGPAFLNRAIENARDPEVEIPREIEGVSREQLLLAMERVLAEHGSPGLAGAIERHRDEVLAAVASFDSLHELVDSLKRTSA
jgi:hypothetical protein